MLAPLRIPLAASLICNPTFAFATYLILGVLVLASRLLFPKAITDGEAVKVEPTTAPANEQRELAKAA